MVTNDGRYTPDTEYRTAMAKVAVNKKKALFTSNWT
jgi:hypothetical protein